MNVCCRMSDELNPAVVPQPVEDVHGDGRWISQVGDCIATVQNAVNTQIPSKQPFLLTDLVIGFVRTLLYFAITKM